MFYFLNAEHNEVVKYFCYSHQFISEIRKDSQSLSAKLLSLLGSASILVEGKDQPSITSRYISPVPDDIADDIADDVIMRDNGMHRLNNGNIWIGYLGFPNK